MNLSDYFLKDGRFTHVGALTTFGFGVGIIALVLSFPVIDWVFFGGICIGVVLIALAAYDTQANTLGRPPPFTNDPLGWRKAKKSYETKEDSDEAPKKGDQS
jgi:hypothetical protein